MTLLICRQPITLTLVGASGSLCITEGTVVDVDAVLTTDPRTTVGQALGAYRAAFAPVEADVSADAPALDVPAPAPPPRAGRRPSAVVEEKE